MVPSREIRQRAFMMGIRTGQMPNVDLIWNFQAAEGFAPCFGQGRNCDHRDCQWHKSCVALDFFAEGDLPITPATETPSPVRKVHSRTPVLQDRKKPVRRRLTGNIVP